MDCKLCATESIYLFERKLDRPDFSNYKHVYYECPSCYFVFSTGLDNLTDKEWGEFYKYPEYLRFDPPANGEYKTRNFESGRIKFVERQIERAKAFRKEPIEKVLIWGNGMSLLLEKLDKSYDAYAMYSHTGLDKDLTQEELSKHENSFDLVVSAEVVEHFTNPLEEFGMMKNLLKEGGQILASTGSKDTFFRKGAEGMKFAYALSYILASNPRNGGHISFYSLESTKFIATSLGMQNNSIGSHLKICMSFTK